MRFALYSLLHVTQTAYANQYANALHDSSRLNSMQDVTTSIACHLLLNQLHLDYGICGMLPVSRAELRFLQICGYPVD